jgi:hypothetical protein
MDLSALRAAVAASPRSARSAFDLALALARDARDEADLSEAQALLESTVRLASASNRLSDRGLADEVRSSLALVLLQAGREAESAPLLKALHCRYRLSSDVLAYALPGESEPADGPPDEAVALDGALPSSLVDFLATALSPDAEFWSAHGYSPGLSPYFSYSHALNTAGCTGAWGQALLAIHAVARSLLPRCGGATHVEWWAHSRPHGSGHQLHFDSDAEGAPDASGEPRHPLASCVLYLSDAIGGPTLVTRQRRGDTALARTAWLCHAKHGRLLVFDGALLHGVLPGRGPSPASGRKRTTLMLAFWAGIDVRPGIGPGASRPFPTDAGWAVAMRGGGGSERAGWGAEEVAARRVGLREVTMWSEVDRAECEREGTTLDALQGMPHYDLCFQGF